MEKHIFSQHQQQKDIDHKNNQGQNNQDCIVFISLSHYEMHKLVHDPQSFLRKVQDLNDQAKKKIQLNAYKQALMLLNEGEKILEYAAGSGKTIQRDLIICILHNIACVHQKLWCLDKCLSYVEGLIFNLENHLTSLQNSVMSSHQKDQMLIAIQSLQMKQLLAEYCIRFCALNSQKNNHKQALISSKKSIGYIRNMLTFDENYYRKMFKKQKQFQSNFQLKFKLLNEIIQFQNNMNIKKHKQILKAAHFCLQIWNKNKQKGTNNNNFKFLKNYSIGDFMDLKAKDYTSRNDKLNTEQLKQKQFNSSIVFKIILLSMSFFSTSTELRLNVSEQQYYSQIQKQHTFHYIEAEIYHLLAIILITGLFSFDILYIKHVLASYTNYFNSGLVEYKTVETQSLEKVVFLISDSKYQMAQLGSTEIISSDQNIPANIINQYHLKVKLVDNKKKTQRKPFHKQKKKNQRSTSKKNNSSNFSNLQTKSIIKEGGYRYKNIQIKQKQKSRQKTKSKPKTKSKTLQKKSKEKIENYYFIKPNNNKNKNKITYGQLHTISKKVSPKKQTFKQIGSEIANKNHKKIVTRRSQSKKRRNSKSIKAKHNIYGLDI